MVDLGYKCPLRELRFYVNDQWVPNAILFGFPHGGPWANAGPGALTRGGLAEAGPGAHAGWLGGSRCGGQGSLERRRITFPHVRESSGFAVGFAQHGALCGVCG